MSTKQEIQAILKALDSKRDELSKPNLSSGTTMRLEREIRNLRYALENSIRKLITMES